MKGTIRVDVDLLEEENDEAVAFIWKTRQGHKIKFVDFTLDQLYVQGVYEENHRTVPVTYTSVIEALREITDDDNHYLQHKATLKQYRPTEGQSGVVILGTNVRDNDIDYFVWEPEFEIDIPAREVVALSI